MQNNLYKPMDKNKRELIEKIFLDKAFELALEGERIIVKGNRNEHKRIFDFRIVKEKVTEKTFKEKHKIIFSKKHMGYHYIFKLNNNDNIDFIAEEKHLNSLEQKVLNGQDY